MITVKPNNVHELTKAILELYKNDESREKLGKNTRKFTEENLDWIAKKTVEIYEDLNTGT